MINVVAIFPIAPRVCVFGICLTFFVFDMFGKSFVALMS